MKEEERAPSQSEEFRGELSKPASQEAGFLVATLADMPGEPMQFLYQFGPGDRPELATDSTAWTEADERVFTDHFEWLKRATEEGTLILAGRSPDDVGPAIVVFEAESEEAARRFMEQDPFVKEGLFHAELHPFRVALLRGRGA